MDKSDLDPAGKEDIPAKLDKTKQRIKYGIFNGYDLKSLLKVRLKIR